MPNKITDEQIEAAYSLAKKAFHSDIKESEIVCANCYLKLENDLIDIM